MSHLNLYTLHIGSCSFSCDIFYALIIIVVVPYTVIKNLLGANTKLEFLVTKSHVTRYLELRTQLFSSYLLSKHWFGFGEEPRGILVPQQMHSWLISSRSPLLSQSSSWSSEDLAFHYWALFFRNRWKSTCSDHFKTRCSDPLIFNLQFVRLFTVKVAFTFLFTSLMEIFLFKSKSKELYHAWRYPFQGNKHLTCPFMCIKILIYHLYISIPHTSPLFRMWRFTQNNTIIKTVRSSLVLLNHFYGKKGGKKELNRHTTDLKKKKKPRGRICQSNNRLWRTHRLHYQIMCKKVMKMWESQALESSCVSCHSSGNTGATFRKYKRSSL